jgi:hypothetical protein
MKKKSILAVAFAYVVMAIFGVSAVANAAAVTMEGAYLVRNATNNEQNYVQATSAKEGDTLRYMVYYHNTMNENSGLDAKNLVIKATVPTNEGTTHVGYLTVQGSNTNLVSTTNNVTTDTNTVLEYVAGSASRRYDNGTNAHPNWVTVPVDDSIVGSGYVVPDMKPCFNFEESIVFSVKVVEKEKPKTPECTLTINKSQIEKGDSAELSYTTKNAETASIDNGIGEVAVGSGKVTVKPTENTTYTLTAKGDGGTVTCAQSITLKEKPQPKPCPKPTPKPTPQPPVVTETGKGNLPESGPAEAAAGAVGLTSTGAAAYAWMRSKKALLGAIKKIK